MVKDNTTFVGITMPNWLADEFLNESQERFGDCRWLTVLYYKRLYRLMWEKTEPECLAFIEHMRLEHTRLIKELYNKK